METNEERLVRLCKVQLPYNKTAFEVLLRQFEPTVFQTCHRYLGHRQEAEEACQDVMLRVFHGLVRFDQRSSFRTWLFRITANVCATRWSRLKKRAEAVEKFWQAAELDSSTLQEPTDVQFAEVTGVIGESLESLADSDRQVLVLRHVAELSFEELSGALEIGLSATKMRLYRAEQRLRAAYAAVKENSEK